MDYDQLPSFSLFQWLCSSHFNGDDPALKNCIFPQFQWPFWDRAHFRSLIHIGLITVVEGKIETLNHGFPHDIYTGCRVDGEKKQ